MKKNVAIAIVFSLMVLSGCGDTNNTYNSQAGISVDNSKDDHSKNTEGQVAVSSEVDVTTDVDKSTNNNKTTNNESDFSVIDSDEYKQLQNKNEQLEKENANLQTQIKELENQQNNIPVIEYKDLGLSIDGEDIPINRNKSMVTINGYEYVSKEIADRLIQNGQNLSVNDNILSVGKIVADKSNLFDKHVNDKSNCDFNDTHMDSFGNICSNVLVFDSNNSHKIIFVLDRKYTFLKFNVSVSDYAYNDRNGVIVIKADNETVYTSENINKQTEPFPESDIAINNCSLLTIEYNSDFHNECLIYNAVVYN